MTRLPPLSPAVAATRVAVRRFATEAARWFAANGAGARGHEDPPLLLVALSGGADSLALAAALAFEAPRAGVRAGAVVVDHGLQAGSGEVAARAAAQARGLGLDPVLVRRVTVRGAALSNTEANAPGEPSRLGSVRTGPEAAAREARYEAFESVIAETKAALLLTAHTRDDQAEQVLLALARGSGTRAIAGIPTMRGAIVRPFLEVTRETTEAACQAQGLDPWIDPHNADPSFARVRVRERVLPVFEAELGPGIAANLARSAELAREDADALDEMARQELRRLATVLAGGAGVQVPILDLAMQPAALRQRIIRQVAREYFGSHLSREHTLTIAALITEWRGQGPIDVPGLTVGRTGARESAVLTFRAR